jgi:hypothetical protein
MNVPLFAIPKDILDKIYHDSELPVNAEEEKPVAVDKEPVQTCNNCGVESFDSIEDMREHYKTGLII